MVRATGCALFQQQSDYGPCVMALLPPPLALPPCTFCVHGSRGACGRAAPHHTVGHCVLLRATAFRVWSGLVWPDLALASSVPWVSWIGWVGLQCAASGWIPKHPLSPTPPVIRLLCTKRFYLCAPSTVITLGIPGPRPESEPAGARPVRREWPEDLRCSQARLSGRRRFWRSIGERAARHRRTGQGELRRRCSIVFRSSPSLPERHACLERPERNLRARMCHPVHPAAVTGDAVVAYGSAGPVAARFPQLDGCSRVTVALQAAPAAPRRPPRRSLRPAAQSSAGGGCGASTAHLACWGGHCSWADSASLHGLCGHSSMPINSAQNSYGPLILAQPFLQRGAAPRLRCRCQTPWTAARGCLSPLEPPPGAGCKGARRGNPCLAAKPRNPPCIPALQGMA